MGRNPDSYKEGERVKIFKRGPKGPLLCDLTLSENYCRKAFNRMLFFKYNIAPDDYRAVKVTPKDE